MKKEQYIDMKSPITGGRIKLIEDIEEQEFRKETYHVHVRYYICEDTGEQFTADGQDDLVLNQIYSQYRLAHGIPFADEIIAIREHYGLNYTQICKILGFGTNQWKQYEQGVMPSESNGKIIVTIRNKQCMLDLLEASRSEFQDAEYNKLRSNIASASEENRKTQEHRLFYGRTERGLKNGFSAMNPEKLQAMIQYLIEKNGGVICPTKLNKTMFYSDFVHFRRYGQSISGLQYRAIQYGPVPEHYDTIYDNIEGLTKESVIQFDNESIRLRYDNSTNISKLTKEEIETLTFVASILSTMTTSEVVKLSHQEEAWKKHEKGHDIIPYSEAFELVGIQ